MSMMLLISECLRRQAQSAHQGQQCIIMLMHQLRQLIVQLVLRVIRITPLKMLLPTKFGIAFLEQAQQHLSRGLS